MTCERRVYSEPADETIPAPQWLRSVHLANAMGAARMDGIQAFRGGELVESSMKVPRRHSKFDGKLIE